MLKNIFKESNIFLKLIAYRTLFSLLRFFFRPLPYVESTTVTVRAQNWNSLVWTAISDDCIIHRGCMRNIHDMSRPTSMHVKVKVTTFESFPRQISVITFKTNVHAH